MEMRGILVAGPCCRGCRAISADARGVETEIQRIAGHKFNVGSPKQSATSCSARWACPAPRRPRPANATGATAGGTGPGRATNCPKKAAGMAPARQAEIDLYDALSAADAPARPAGCTPRTRSPPPLPAGCPRPIRTCRTSRSAPSRAARSARLRRRSRAQDHLGRLQPDRAAAPRPDRRDPAAGQAFGDGIDIHAVTASDMFGVPLTE